MIFLIVGSERLGSIPAAGKMFLLFAKYEQVRIILKRLRSYIKLRLLLQRQKT